MPLRRYKHPASPPSSDDEDYGGKDEGFVLDPDQNYDELPQPFRLIDKTLSGIFDKAWEAIEKIELERSSNLARAKVPVFDFARRFAGVGEVSCVCSSTDGQFVFVGDDHGVLAVEVMLSQITATYEEPLNVTYVQMDCCFVGHFHLICTLDNAGNMKLLSFSDGHIYLIRHMNEQETGNKPVAATGFTLSQDAGYVAVCWETSDKDNSMEVFRIPLDSWIKELETAKELSAQKAEHEDREEEDSVEEQAAKEEEEHDQSPASSRPGSATSAAQITFSKPTLVLRIHPPVPPVPSTASSCSQAQRFVDGECSVIGSGANHCLLSAFFQNHRTTFQSLHENQLQYLPAEDRTVCSLPTCHFLSPGRLISAGYDSSSTGRVNSLVVWWTGTTQLFIYSLVKSGKDVEHKADIVWPHAQKITSSSASSCTTILAVGLADGTLVTYDMHLGQPLQVLNVSYQSPVSFLSVLPPDALPESSRSSTVSSVPQSTTANIIVCCKDGTFSLVQCGLAARVHITSLNDVILDEKNDCVMKVCTIPRTSPYIVLVIRQSGRITMQDVAQRKHLCHVQLPSPYKPTPPINPCISGAGNMLYIKGAEMDDYNENFDHETSGLFFFPMLSISPLARYRSQETNIPSYAVDNSIETRYNSLIQERIVTQGTRQLRMQGRWKEFQTELKKMQHVKSKQSLSPWNLNKPSCVQEQDVF